MRTVRVWLRQLVPCFALCTLVLGACVSEQQEQEIGDAMAADVNHQIPLVRDPLLNAYVTHVGRAIAAVSGRPRLDYHFYIINSAMVNAFALPGGHVYVTRGLIRQTRSGGELAAVLAHEIGHVASRHGVQKLQRQLRTGSLVSMLYTLILGGEPELLRRNALQLAGVIWSARHSREDEEEADRLAVVYLQRAGVDPEGMVTLLEALRTLEASEPASTRAASWFSTHPLTAERIVKAEREIQALDHKPPPRTRLKLSSYPAFLRRVDALPPPPDAPGPRTP